MILDPEQDLRHRQIVWAGRYDGYRRLAGGVSELSRVVDLLARTYVETGTIPSWAGVDLLRGWAFLLVRADHHGGGYGLALGGAVESVWLQVLTAVAEHPATRPAERPPLSARPPHPQTAAADRPRRHGDPAFLAAQRARVHEPHVAPLTALADRAAAERPGTVVPHPDPDSGGVTARVLLLHDSPTRAAGATGILSVDADTATAAAAWAASTQPTVSRFSMLHWPAVPWAVPRATGNDVAASARWRHETLGLLPDLRVVIPLGPVASLALATAAQDLAARDVHVLAPRGRDLPAHDERFTGFAAVEAECLRRAMSF
jgi:hypothetical protein